VSGTICYLCLRPLITRHACVLPDKCEAGFAVIHRFPAGFPMDELKINTVVLRMALGTILARSGRAHPNRVHAAALRDPFADLRVAFKTF